MFLMIKARWREEYTQQIWRQSSPFTYSIKYDVSINGNTFYPMAHPLLSCLPGSTAVGLQMQYWGYRLWPGDWRKPPCNSDVASNQLTWLALYLLCNLDWPIPLHLARSSAIGCRSVCAHCHAVPSTSLSLGAACVSVWGWEKSKIQMLFVIPQCWGEGRKSWTLSKYSFTSAAFLCALWMLASLLLTVLE